MAYLLTSNGSNTQASAGGKPLGDPSVRWPTCKKCQGHMQYMATLPVDQEGRAAPGGDTLLLLFQCQQQPGMCDEWSAESGGNGVLMAATDEVLPLTPPSGPTTLGARTSLGFVEYPESEDSEGAEEQYYSALSAPQSVVVGKAGGCPIWIQYDETPVCDCGRSMAFIAQLEENAAEGLNFGAGGSGYLFLCSHCRSKAKFLWQC